MRTLLFLPGSISTHEGLSKLPGLSLLARETEEGERKDEEIPNACAQVASKRLYIRNAAVVRWLHTLSNNGNEMNQIKSNQTVPFLLFPFLSFCCCCY